MFFLSCRVRLEWEDLLSWNNYLLLWHFVCLSKKIVKKYFRGFHSIPFYRGSTSDNWRNDTPQTNDFQSSRQKAGTGNYYSERNGFRSDRNGRSSPLNESSGFGRAWSRGRGRFNSSGSSSTDQSFNSSPVSEPLRIEVSNDYIGKVIGELISISPFVLNAPFLYPMKTSEKPLRFSNVSRSRERVHLERMG